MSILNLINCLITKMSGCFKVIRWMLATVLIGLLFLVVITGVPISVFSQSITQKDTFKEWLKSSGLYDDALDISIEMMSENLKDDTEMSYLLLQIEDPESEIGKIIHDKFTPQFIEQSTNTMLDGTYDWLEGNTENLTFEIQIVEDEDELINILTVGFQTKLAGLPACTHDYEIPSDFSLLTAECLPPEYNPEEVSTYLTDNTDTEEIQKLLEIAELGSVDTNVDPETTRVFRQAFRAFNVMPFIFAGVIFILSLLIILLVPGSKTGLIITGLSLAIPSVIIYIGRIFASGATVSTSISETSFSTVNSSESTLSTETVEILVKALESVSQNIYVDILEKTGMYCIALIAISTILVIIGISLRDKGSSEKYKPAPKNPKSSKANTETKQKQPAPKTPSPSVVSPSPPVVPPATPVAPPSSQSVTLPNPNPQENPTTLTPGNQPQPTVQPPQPVQPPTVQPPPTAQPQQPAQSPPTVQPTAQPTPTVPAPLNNNDLESIMPKHRPTAPTPPPA